ncbi:vitamin K epoxide reductase family protein [Patescibacteria group bacterium]|nr:vitamin K epoxide reductase family protein [Patescibacteria group bacterium]
MEASIPTSVNETPKFPFWQTRAFMLFAFLGFLDAMYLTANHYFGVPLQCGGSNSCETVTTSVYAYFYGTPIALFGTLYYLGIFFGSLIASEFRSYTLKKYLSIATIIGLGVSTYFMIVMFGILHAVCYYCIASAITSTALFVIGYGTLIKEHLKK